MELTEEELRQREETARQEGRARFESELVQGTTWQNATAMKESATNAENKISEIGQQRKTLEDQLADANREREELKAKQSGNQSGDQGGQGGGGQGRNGGGNGDDQGSSTQIDPETILKSMSDKEANELDALAAHDEELKKAVASGDKKKMAEIVVAYRDMAPKQTTDKPFSSYRENSAGGGATSLQDMLKRADDSYRKRKRVPTGGGRASAPSGDVDDDSTRRAPVRAGGGMFEMKHRGEDLD